ncbi:hypothetical protein [Frondihabitans peucedani]|uniref:DprA winged helix domain-containing protein n=1 Tax=Frondihabitans peucedani TaxID=598626 RepID=A0ABP8DYL2_9MICO
MSRPIKLRHPPRFTRDIVDDARQRVAELADDLGRLLDEYGDDIEVWGSAVTTAGWELAALGQWLGLEGEAVLLLGGASYPEIAEHQGTSASNVYNRVGRSLTLAPYATASGSVAKVTAEALTEARLDYAHDDPRDDDDADGPAEGSLADRIPAVLADGRLSTVEIARRLPEYRRSSVLSTLSHLAREGTILRTGHGVYALPG